MFATIFNWFKGPPEKEPEPDIWVGVIALNWHDSDDPTKKLDPTFIHLFESKETRYIKHRQFGMDYIPHNHPLYAKYIVPWLNGIDISSELFQTFNSEAPGIYIKKNKIKDKKDNVVQVDFKEPK